ncbi:hypothetical protein BH10PSE6_BH10PSE6_49880 [soil metagenome]
MRFLLEAFRCWPAKAATLTGCRKDFLTSPLIGEQRPIRKSRLKGMAPPFRTFIFLGVAVGMLGAGYVFAPQPGANTRPVTPVAKTAPPATVPKPAMAVASRPPVPLGTRGPTTYFVNLTESATMADATQIPTTLTTNGMAQAKAVSSSPSNARTDVQAKASVERDGYKNVSGLVKAADGRWHGRAMRGSTEIAISVDANGSVSAQ